MIPPRDHQRQVDAELIEYVVAIVPDEAAAEIVLASVYALAACGTIAVLDCAIIARDTSGAVQVADPSPPPMGDAGPERPGVMTEHDLGLIADAVGDDSVAIVVLLEDRWASGLAGAARDVGGHIAGGERIPAHRAVTLLGSGSSRDGC